MKEKTSRFQDKLVNPLLCCICGDKARGINFSVASCMSCKMFFRRHAQSQSTKYRCHFNGDCTITQKTRKFCLSCRLKQCFQAGMNPQLIRLSQQQQRKYSVNTKTSLPQPKSLSLLLTDRSTLTIDEWNLLSNIVHSYDAQNLFLQTSNFLQKQSSLPPKIRSKVSNTLTHIGSLFSNIQAFIGRCPQFYSLPSSIRKALIQRNLNVLGSFNAFFMAKEMNILENEEYSKLIDNIYGIDYSNAIIQASHRLQENRTLIKVMLITIAFSSNCSIVTIDDLKNIHTKMNSIVLIHIQDIFVTMLWKYLIYQYGLNEAILRFSSLIKSILDMLQRVEQSLYVQKHWNMVANIVEQTTRTLSIEDIPPKD